MEVRTAVSAEVFHYPELPWVVIEGGLEVLSLSSPKEFSMPRDIPPEPTFLLRARDHGTDEALVRYHAVAKDTGASPEALADIQQAIEKFRAFPVDVPAGREPVGSAPGSSIPDSEAEKKPEPPAAAAKPAATSKAT